MWRKQLNYTCKTKYNKKINTLRNISSINSIEWKNKIKNLSKKTNTYILLVKMKWKILKNIESHTFKYNLSFVWLIKTQRKKGRTTAHKAQYRTLKTKKYETNQTSGAPESKQMNVCLMFQERKRGLRWCFIFTCFIHLLLNPALLANLSKSSVVQVLRKCVTSWHLSVRYHVVYLFIIYILTFSAENTLFKSLKTLTTILYLVILHEQLIVLLSL